MAGNAPHIPGCRDLSLIGERVARSLFAATSDRVGRPVTVTVFPPLSEGRTWEQFDRAAATAQRLGAHPSVVTIHEWGHAPDGRPWVVTDPQPPDSVDTLLTMDGPLEVERGLQVGVLLAGALETAHRAGIVHGDLSPARLVFGTHGEPLLAETGLAAFAVFPGLGALNNPVRYYAPPEVLERTEVSPATDVFSLATTVYALLAGRAPQQKPAEVTDSNASLLLRILQMPVPPIERPGLPPGLEDALRGPLSPSPDKRPQQAIEMAWLLQDAQRRAGFAITEPVVLDLDGTDVEGSARRPPPPPAPPWAQSAGPVGPPARAKPMPPVPEAPAAASAPSPWAPPPVSPPPPAPAAPFAASALPGALDPPAPPPPTSALPSPPLPAPPPPTPALPAPPTFRPVVARSGSGAGPASTVAGPASAQGDEVLPADFFSFTEPDLPPTTVFPFSDDPDALGLPATVDPPAAGEAWTPPRDADDPGGRAELELWSAATPDAAPAATLWPSTWPADTAPPAAAAAAAAWQQAQPPSPTEPPRQDSSSPADPPWQDSSSPADAPWPQGTSLDSTTDTPWPADTTSDATTDTPWPADTASGTTTDTPWPADTTSGTTTDTPWPADTTSGTTTDTPWPADTTSGTTSDTPWSDDAPGRVASWPDDAPAEEPPPNVPWVETPAEPAATDPAPRDEPSEDPPPTVAPWPADPPTGSPPATTWTGAPAAEAPAAALWPSTWPSDAEPPIPAPPAWAAAPPPQDEPPASATAASGNDGGSISDGPPLTSSNGAGDGGGAAPPLFPAISRPPELDELPAWYTDPLPNAGDRPGAGIPDGGPAGADDRGTPGYSPGTNGASPNGAGGPAPAPGATSGNGHGNGHGGDGQAGLPGAPGNGLQAPPGRTDAPGGLPGAGDELRSLFGEVVRDPDGGPPARPPAPPGAAPPVAPEADPLGPPSARPPIDLSALDTPLGPAPYLGSSAPPAPATNGASPATPARLPRRHEVESWPASGTGRPGPAATAATRQAPRLPRAGEPLHDAGGEATGGPRLPRGDGQAPRPTAASGPPALPLIILIAVVAVLVAGVAWLVLTGDEAAPPASERPAGAETDSSADTTTGSGSEADATAPAPTGLQVGQDEDGVQVTWSGAADATYVVTVLTADLAPKALPAAVGTTARVPTADLGALDQWCITVAVATDGGTGAASEPACAPGTSLEAMRGA